MKNDLIITGWGWKEYAVAAAAALRALKGEAEVVGLAWECLCRVVPIVLVCAAVLVAVVGVLWLIGRVARMVGGK